MNLKKIVDSSILISTFKRSKVESEIVKPFDNFSETIQAKIVEQICFENNERSAILSFNNNDRWILITSHRIVQRDNGKLISMYYSDINNVEINKNEPLSRSISCKKQLDTIALDMKTGEKILLNIGDSGSVIFPLENALSWAVIKANQEI
jgi:hypothetical protein